MSITVMGWVYAQSKSHLADRLVLLAIADEADDDGGNAYPSLRRIAQKANVSLPTAHAAVARLEAIGELAVKRPERTGRGHHNEYAILMGNVQDLERSPQGETFGNVRKRSAQACTDPLTHLPLEVQDLALAPRTRHRDPHWDAMVDCWQIEAWELTTAERGRLNKACKELRDVGADPDEIPARRAMYALLFPDAAQTPMALVNRWAECRPDPSRIPLRPGRGTSAVARAIARAQ